MDPTTLVLVAALLWSGLAAIVVILCLVLMAWALVLLLRQDRRERGDPPALVSTRAPRFQSVAHPAEHEVPPPPTRATPEHLAASRFGGGLGATRRPRRPDLSDQQAAAYAGAPDPEGAWEDVPDEPLVQGEH